MPDESLEAGSGLFYGTGYRPVWGSRSRAQWGAVLGPTLTVEQRKQPLGAQMADLRALWRRRLSDLRDLGWEPVQDDARFQTARNCPPFGCKKIQILRTCKLRPCPFCWARDVVGQLHDLLTRTPSTPFAYVFDETIVELPRKGLFRASAWHESGGLAEVVELHRGPGPLRTASGERPRLRQPRRSRQPGLVAGWLQQGVVLGEEKGTLRRRGIVVCDRPWEEPARGTRWKRLKHAEERVRPSEARLPAAYAAGYHAWWLRGDPVWVLFVLRELERVRLVTCYGTFRGVPRGPVDD